MIHSCEALGSAKKNVAVNNGNTVLNRRVSVKTCADKPFDGREQQQHEAAPPHVSHVTPGMIAAEIWCAFYFFIDVFIYFPIDIIFC